MSKFAAFLLTRFMTTKFLTKVFLLASEYLTTKTENKWDDKLHKLAEEALK